ncbi:M20 family metallopeptidase [Micromonospora fiedleri]|uniref:M20 family metallopeptidase n=1 Tax=Micromonospora fiedleri TaxID=1157498 RepID=A0ABS1UPP2_9ACTN|nr:MULTISPECIES: M20 family metallopeptidase [Micromonospora]MBL6278295.1 M20 family metallopeptidase [Micromonospora fiedleri]WSK41383.1 M20 family metallopeptidase [Micromonospora maris]
MDHARRLRHAADKLQADMVDQLGTLVAYESAPGSLPHLESCADLLARWGTEVLGRPAQRVVLDGLPHLLWPAVDQRVLLLGHFDTVFPIGTTETRPFTVRGNVATGPGVCDMKAGIVQMFAALRLVEDTSTVGVLLTCDEESGSVTSRPLIEREARRSGAVLVCEAATPEGHVKVARKGGSVYRLTIQGRAAHAGVEPQRGINATVEVAHQVLALGALGTADSAGTSVTPTLLSAGTTTNTVPESASLAVDVRAWSKAELERVDHAIRRLQPHLSEATLTVCGGINRYPMPAELAQPLLEMARSTALALGMPDLVGAYAAGASDGNFTAALGVPTLDGLGAVGGGAHSADEYVCLDRMPERTALLAGLVETVSSMEGFGTQLVA